VSAKPFLVNLYLITERYIGLNSIVGRESLFILEGLRFWYGFSGPSRNGPLVTNKTLNMLIFHIYWLTREQGRQFLAVISNYHSRFSGINYGSHNIKNFNNVFSAESFRSFYGT